jgi:hypothetical protein
MCSMANCILIGPSPAFVRVQLWTPDARLRTAKSHVINIGKWSRICVGYEGCYEMNLRSGLAHVIGVQMRKEHAQQHRILNREPWQKAGNLRLCGEERERGGLTRCHFEDDNGAYGCA